MSHAGAERIDGVETDVIDALPAATEGRVARYYIAKSDGLVTRIEWRKGTSATPSSWVQLKDSRRNLPVDPGRFAWKLPKNASPLELPLSVRLPGIGGGRPLLARC